MLHTAKTNSNQDDDEIDLLALAKTLWSSRRKVLVIVLAFTFSGLAIAFLLPKTYTASSTFIPQTADSGKASGSLGGLASLAGISLGGIPGGSEVPPALYPKFVSSTAFRQALLDAKISLPGTIEKVSYRQYFVAIHSPGPLALVKEYTVGLPEKILGGLRATKEDMDHLEIDTGFLRISKEERRLFTILEEQLTVTPNEEEGFVTISFDMPDPVMAAQMASYAEALLQKEVISYKIQNAREQLKFTEEQFEEKKIAFEKIQAELATFRDRNQNIISASVNNELQRLEAEYNFAFTIYSELAKQLEQAKLQVSKDTPIFSIIEPVTIPTEKSGPKRPFILAVFLILGAIVGVGYVFGIEFVKRVQEQWSALR
ncbi:LPS O-antigen chain length determinant protein, WzzB/FepE family [Cyclobacterium xiamenense]|uniref:LPS O-antigen chain length determinant protein, WzzB/FepE family n=1 Tax=Cyclobacterium xiamenense TaxID=1297121 RepID=A0A1H6YT56_9BACT|nr:Wzz/FepE/Etk N-terminal domain-containing protein [Cyclobacterium xiamenense]SEJ40462.1 LPS O-antigen chain length determinant protein, WzzB/FepE family [Cyclobacterium xiamenense]